MAFAPPRPIQDPTPEKAYLYAIRLLAKRDYSEHKIRQKLKEKGFPAEHQEFAVQEITQKNYLREDSYIESKTRGWMHKGYSPSFISFRFSQEKIQIDEDAILEIFAKERVTVEDQIQQLMDKKRITSEILESGQEAYKKRQKFLAYLISKGHDYQSSLQVIRAILHQ